MATEAMAAIISVDNPATEEVAGAGFIPPAYYARESFILSSRWMAFIRETEGDVVVDQILNGCQVVPWSFTKAATGMSMTGAPAVGDETANSIKIILDNSLTDHEIGEKMARLFELFERAESRQIATQNKSVKFQLTEHVLFKGDISGFVIGKGGNNLWNIKQYTGVDLLVVDDGRKQIEPKPDGFDRLIINGSSSYFVHNARYQVQHLFSQAASIAPSPYVPLYPIQPAPALDPYNYGAGAAGGYNYFGAGGGGMMGGGGGLPPYSMSGPSGIYSTPSPLSIPMPALNTPLATNPLKRPAPSAIGLDATLPKRATLENGGGGVDFGSVVTTQPLPASLAALMEAVSVHFSAAQKQVEDSIGALIEQAVNEREQELKKEVASLKATVEELKQQLGIKQEQVDGAVEPADNSTAAEGAVKKTDVMETEGEGAAPVTESSQ